MPRATNHDTTAAVSRRNLAGFGAALFALGGGATVAAAALALDAELLAAYAEAHAIDAESNAIWDAVEHLPGSDPRCEVAYEHATREMPKFHALVARAAELPARTPDGLRAKAELALSYLANSEGDAEIALSLARDVLGRA